VTSKRIGSNQYQRHNQSATASNLDISHQLLLTLIKSCRSSHSPEIIAPATLKHLRLLLDQPQCPSTIIETALDLVLEARTPGIDKVQWLQRAVHHPNTPPHIIDRIAQTDPMQPLVKLALLTVKNGSPDQWFTFLQKHPRLRTSALNAPHCPVESVRCYVTDRMRQAANGDVPIDYNDLFPLIRIAANQLTEDPLITTVFALCEGQSSNLGLMRAWLHHPQCPPVIQRRIWTRYPDRRQDFADAPNCLPELRAILSLAE